MYRVPDTISYWNYRYIGTRYQVPGAVQLKNCWVRYLLRCQVPGTGTGTPINQLRYGVPGYLVPPGTNLPVSDVSVRLDVDRCPKSRCSLRNVWTEIDSIYIVAFAGVGEKSFSPIPLGALHMYNSNKMPGHLKHALPFTFKKLYSNPLFPPDFDSIKNLGVQSKL